MKKLFFVSVLALAISACSTPTANKTDEAKKECDTTKCVKKDSAVHNTAIDTIK